MAWHREDEYVERVVVKFDEAVTKFVERFTRFIDVLIEQLTSETPATTLHLTTKGIIMANYQLNAGDSVVITITDTDDVTGSPVTPDAGSVTAVLSSSTDTIVVDPSGTFATITAGETLGTNNTVTVNATVGGVASTPAVGNYDVVADVVPDATSLGVTFGTESAPSGTATADELDATGGGSK
jgi:hypothetical protein